MGRRTEEDLMKSTGKIAASPASDKAWAEQEKEWKAQSDLETLISAEKIKADPDRLKAAMKKKAEMQKALKAVEG